MASRWVGSGIRVVEVIYVTPRAYLVASRTSAGWRPYELDSHPITLEAALAGHAPTDVSREALFERIRPGAGTVIYSESGLDDIEPITVPELNQQGRLAAAAHSELIPRVLKAITEADWLSDLINEAELADREVMVELFTEALRAAQPGTDRASIAAEAAAFFAWLNGNGALACACLEHCDLSSRLAALVRAAVSGAVNPANWDPHRA